VIRKAAGLFVLSETLSIMKVILEADATMNNAAPRMLFVSGAAAKATERTHILFSRLTGGLS
jgi:hypothetical protein